MCSQSKRTLLPLAILAMSFVAIEIKEGKFYLDIVLGQYQYQFMLTFSLVLEMEKMYHDS